MTPKVLLTLAIIAAVAISARFIALEFQAAAWVLYAIGISAVAAAIGVAATEVNKASQNQRE